MAERRIVAIRQLEALESEELYELVAVGPSFVSLAARHGSLCGDRGRDAGRRWGDVAGAIVDLAAVDGSGFHGPALEADRTTIRAGIAALEMRGKEALTLYRESLLAWRDLGLVWDEALCGLDMALLLDPAESDVRAAADRARETLVRLEAAPFIARLDAALARSPGPRGQPASPARVVSGEAVVATS